jgi:DNA-binding FadR family transcriptional regulator
VRLTTLDSDILRFILEHGYGPGDQLPTIREVSEELGVSVAKTREALEVARGLGMLEIKPGRGTRVAEYDFAPAATLSALYAIGLEGQNFAHLREVRDALEIYFWKDAVSCLTDDDLDALRRLVRSAQRQLNREPAQVPSQAHRQLHLLLFSRLDNPFVTGILEAFWESYEAFGLHLYRDLDYHRTVWDYHARILDAVEAGDYDGSRELLIEHMNLLSERQRAANASEDGGADIEALRFRRANFE